MNMAFLSSFKIGPDTVYPEALRQRLRAFPLLEDVSDAGIKKLLSEANWFGLPGGMMLKRDGENAQAVFLVITGSLGVFAEDDRGKRRLVAHIGAGETVGEMSMISGSTEHSAQIVALRDSELLRVPPAAFDALIARHPRVMLNLMRILV
ncbi:MAG: cyclic nucleotide-binding domain-containing protein, partial [Alphaproteobacteria bacterium]|nr:cyclic nucleotide-binding domain-containing protein [Alphaproteobacteria bacterium]